MFKQFYNDRIDSSQWLIEFLMHFKFARNLIVKSKFGKVGTDTDIRPHTNFYGTRNIEIGDRVSIRDGAHISSVFSGSKAAEGVKLIIGSDVLIAPDVMITTNAHKYSDPHQLIRQQGGYSESVIIEDDVWIGRGATILHGVTIGRGSVIGAHSLVNKSIPPNSVAVGTPCKVIKK
ncbi:MAG: acyltransferase, partial [Candidatus Omnitrophica bacterium]|nr:acyltransferase [Candidatus Omnitrophota bacterium]